MLFNGAMSNPDFGATRGNRRGVLNRNLPDGWKKPVGSGPSNHKRLDYRNLLPVLRSRDFDSSLNGNDIVSMGVADLLNLLDISDAQGGTVLMDSRFLSKEERLPPGSQVLIFQALNGG
jgi:hypothetical protein